MQMFQSKLTLVMLLVVFVSQLFPTCVAADLHSVEQSMSETHHLENSLPLESQQACCDIAINTCSHMVEVNDQGDVRYARKNNFLSLLSLRQIAELCKDIQQPSVYWQARKNKLRRFIRWMTSPESPEEMSKVADEVYKKYNHELTITSGLEGTHSSSSLHYYGLALDFRTRFFSTAVKNAVYTILNGKLKNSYVVVLEKTHIHIQWRF